MRTRTPFYGMPEDLELLGSMGDGSEPLPDYELPSDIPQSFFTELEESVAETTAGPHPNYRELGTEMPLGFMPHQGENRRQRRAAVATWSPKDHPTAEPVGAGAEESGTRPDVEPAPPPPLPTRRELWAQRQRQRRGTLDPGLRRLQRRKAAESK